MLKINIHLFILLVTWTGNINTQFNRKCKEEIPKNCDYIIAGAGAAGAVIASRLSEDPDVVVCLFEAGPPDTNQRITPLVEIPRIWTGLTPGDFSWNYTTVPQRGLNGREVFTGMGKVKGGSTTVNGFAYFRGFKVDFDSWAANGATGWSYRDVLPFFLKAENNVSPLFKNFDLRKKCGPLTIDQNLDIIKTPLFKLLSNAARDYRLPEAKCIDPAPFGICQFLWTVKSGKRESTATAYLRPSAGRKNLFVSTESLVVKILITRRQKRAHGVQFIKNGRRFTAYARREVIVSCGTFDSPKLLQRSGIGPSGLLRKFKIRQQANLPVGENYQDHVVIFLEVSLDIKTVTFNSLLDQRLISEYLFRRTGVYAAPTGVQSIFFDIRNQRFNWPEIQLGFSDGKIQSLFTPDDLKSEPFLPKNGESNGTTIVFILLHPRSRGTVKLRSLNPNDPPLIDPRVLQEQQDVIDMIRGIRRVQGLVQTPSMRKAGAQLQLPSCNGLQDNSDEHLVCLLRNGVGPESHPVSSCKMGNVNDPSTVVDPNLRVKGIHGLRVADASIMPEVTSGNTMGPSIMIGERAAHMIKQSHTKRRY